MSLDSEGSSDPRRRIVKYDGRHRRTALSSTTAAALACKMSWRKATIVKFVLISVVSLVVIVSLSIQQLRTLQKSAAIVTNIATLLSASTIYNPSYAINSIESNNEIEPTNITHPMAINNALSTNLTDNLPDWLVSYMEWHQRIKPTLTEENWDQHKYLVLRCLSWFPFCSGTSDRLRTFLFLLYVAQSDPNHEHRIFLIHWSRPASLESFLVPPPGGLDWRVPNWLLPKLKLGDESHWQGISSWDDETVVRDYPNKTHYTVVEFSFIFQLSALVDRLQRQYRDCFNALFRPVPEIQALIDKTKDELGLTNRPYTSVHLRMKYTSIDQNEDNVWKALVCAAKIGHPDAPIFVASDSGEMAALAVNIAVERKFSRTVVARKDYHLYPSLHIDMGADFLNPRSEDWKNHNASEYYTVFSDLYLLGDSSCVVAGTGSYGKWGSQLSRNVSCFGNYMTGEGC